jgi:organic hydroperoxide reductase OsmC/OhrA
MLMKQKELLQDMANRVHTYKVKTIWTGNDGQGTQSYSSYRRDHEFHAPGKQVLPGSADPTFRGNPARWNPEELLLASLSACHKLWYLHLCCDNGIVVTDYRDDVTGEMLEEKSGSGRFVNVRLSPRIYISKGNLELARQLHDKAHSLCFIANSVNFPVTCEPKVVAAPTLE